MMNNIYLIFKARVKINISSITLYLPCKCKWINISKLNYLNKHGTSPNGERQLIGQLTFQTGTCDVSNN
jgi:hypothetical protein